MAALASPSIRSTWERRRWLTWAVAFVAILAPMVLWSLASPLMSVPDEPSHAIRAAAVARGEVTSGPWEQNGSLAAATVPENIANGHELICYAFDSTKSAECQAAVRDTGSELVTTGTSAGLNSPAFYAIVGWPSLFLEGDAAFYGMRLVSAVLSAATAAVMIMQLTLLRRWRWAFVGAVVGLTPMVAYLGGSINPNGLEATAAGALFATLLVMFRGSQRGRALWEQAGLALVSASLLVTTRSISLLWVLIIAGVTMLLGSRVRIVSLLRAPAAWFLIITLAVVGAVTVLWYLNPPVLGGGDGTPPAAGLADLVFVAAFTLVRSVDFIFGMIGLFGWVDTPAPSVTIAAWITPILMLVGVGLIWGRKHTRWAVSILLVVMLFVPVFTQLSVYAQYGFIWQGRYMLSMLLCLLIAAGVAIDDARLSVGPRVRRLVTGTLGLLAIGHVTAFFFVLRRYAVGTAGGLSDMVFGDGWEPPFGWKALLALMFVAAALTAVLAWRLFVAAPGEPGDVVPPADGVDAGADVPPRPESIDASASSPAADARPAATL